MSLFLPCVSPVDSLQTSCHRHIHSRWQSARVLPFCGCHFYSETISLCSRFVIVAVALCAHSRPREANFAIRSRMLNRPVEQFRSTTGRQKQDEDLHYVLSPTRPGTDEWKRGRGEHTSSIRARLKRTTSSASLLKILQAAVDKDRVDKWHETTFGLSLLI